MKLNIYFLNVSILIKYVLCFLVHVDAYTGDFIMVEQKNKNCLLSEINFKYGDQFRPSNGLHTVWAVLSSFRDMDLSPGSYLLRHGINDGICVQVWEASSNKESCSLDLHQVYAAVDPKDTITRDPSEMWVALDPFAVFPVQRALNRPPLTFEPTSAPVGGKSII